MSEYSSTVIIPAYEEGSSVIPGIKRVLENTSDKTIIFVVVDSSEDSTVQPILDFFVEEPRLNLLINTYGKGPANAIRYGINSATTQSVVVTMSDGCDDPRLIEELILLVERGVVIASASRYMAGGQQVGGPFLKAFLSRLAGFILYHFARVGTRDPTNSFKGYSKPFIDKVNIDSRTGFEIGLELVAKARRYRYPVAEIPTIWLDRTHGESNFKLAKWIPVYLKWFFFSFGKKLQTNS